MVDRSADNARIELEYLPVVGDDGKNYLEKYGHYRDTYQNGVFSYVEDLCSGKRYVDWKRPIDIDLTPFIAYKNFVDYGVHIDWVQWIDGANVERHFKIDYYSTKDWVKPRTSNLPQLFNDAFGGLGARPVTPGVFDYRPFKSVRAMLVFSDYSGILATLNHTNEIEIVGGSTVHGGGMRVQTVFETLISEVVEEVFGRYGLSKEENVEIFSKFFSDIRGFYVFDHDIVAVIHIDRGKIIGELGRLRRPLMVRLVGDPEVRMLVTLGMNLLITLFKNRFISTPRYAQSAADALNTYFLLQLLA
jgi:hypothetical protein